MSPTDPRAPFPVPPPREYWDIHCLVPDLPDTDALLPYLREMDGSHWYTNFGPLVCRYETALAHLYGGGETNIQAVSFSSGTHALSLALRAMELPRGARVLLPALTFPATLLAVTDAGYIPVLGDVDTRTWMLEPEMVQAVLRRSKLDAVLPVAAFGYPLQLDPWVEFQAQTGVRVLVDAAAALGVQAPPTRADGDLAVVCSLHATKPLGAGEGGVLFTRDAELAGRARLLSNFGFQRSVIQQAGTNAKLSEYHAAVGLAQLDRAARLIARRLELYRAYRLRLPEILFRESATPDVPPAVLSLDTAGKAEQLAAKLTARRIETRRWYCPPLHLHPAFDGVEIASGGSAQLLPGAAALGDSLLGIPFHNFLDDTGIGRVCDAVLAALEAAD